MGRFRNNYNSTRIKDLEAHEPRYRHVINLGDNLIAQEHPESETVNAKKNELMEAWRQLSEVTQRKQEKLCDQFEIQKFFRDADETIAWIDEKDASLQVDDVGRDLASVQALQCRHEAIERDLDAIEEKVSFILFLSSTIFFIPVYAVIHLYNVQLGI